MKTIKAKVVLLRAENQKYQVKQGDVFINDSRNRDWGSLKALVCERVTGDGHTWNGHGIQTDINHLYLISDEEIKDKKIYNKHCLFFGWQGGKDYNDKSPCLAGKDIGRIRTLGKYYEILATTDKSLNLPQIPQSFIKQYVESGGIDEVMVEQYYYAEALNGTSLIPHKVYKFRTDSNNCIIIKPIKESWSREEVEQFRDLADASNYDYLRGFIDGYGGEEPHGIMPDGFNNINEVWDRVYELKNNEEKLYTKEEVEDMLFVISTELCWDDKDEDELILNCQSKIKEIKENL